MEYMILIHGDETASAPPAAPGTPEFAEYMAAWAAYNQRLIDGGHWISGAMLTPTTSSTTIRRGPAGDQVVDGPFAETKEQLAGYYTVTAADLDVALELAAAIPVPHGSIEVRPIAVRPDAG
jgi:hypothetical protein